MRGGGGGERSPRPAYALLAAASLVTALACATGGPSTRAPIPGSAGNKDEATVPPPRGMPPPRLADTPPPETVEEEVDRAEERFLTLHGAEERQRRQVADPRPVPAVAVIPMGATGGEPESCNGLEPNERIACPLRVAGRVESITDLPDGVRLKYRKNVKVTAEKVYRMVSCQQALALANPRATPLCPFLTPGTDVAVSEQEGRMVIESAPARRPGRGRAAEPGADRLPEGAGETQPLTTPSGRSRATLRAMPGARATTSTTRSTSL